MALSLYCPWFINWGCLRGENSARELQWHLLLDKRSCWRSSPDLVSSSEADVGDEMQGERRALRAAQKGSSQTLPAGAVKCGLCLLQPLSAMGVLSLLLPFPSALLIQTCGSSMQPHSPEEQRAVCGSQGAGTGTGWLQGGGQGFHPSPETSPRKS